jgi:antitoxin VapB
MEAVMAFHIRDPETDKVVRELARRKGMTMTEAVRTSAAQELARLSDRSDGDRKLNVREAIRQIQERVAARGKTGLKADKAFYDRLSGDE